MRPAAKIDKRTTIAGYFSLGGDGAVKNQRRISKLIPYHQFLYWYKRIR